MAYFTKVKRRLVTSEGLTGRFKWHLRVLDIQPSDLTFVGIDGDYFCGRYENLLVSFEYIL